MEKITFEFSSTNMLENEQYSNQLLKWFDDANFKNVNIIELKTAPPEDTASGGILIGVSIIATFLPLKEILKTLQLWMQESTKRKNSKFEVKIKNGSHEILIKSENVTPEYFDSLVEKFKNETFKKQKK